MKPPFEMKYLRAEWLRFSRDRSNRWVLALFALLTLVAAQNGLHQVSERTQAQAQAASEAEQRLARMRAEVLQIASDRPLVAQGLDSASPAKLANGDGTFRVALPPGPGAALALGTSVMLPQSIEVSIRSRHTQAANQNLANPAIAGGGGFDLAFVIVVLLPLAVIALTWRVQAHDRELGTWRLIAAVPGAARGLRAAALLLRGATLCAVAWIAGALAVFGHGGFAADALAVWGGYALVVLLVTALWLGLAALLNAGPRPSPTLALALVGLWLLSGLVLPAAIEAAAPPPPSRLATIAELRALDAVASADAAVLDASYRADHPEAMPGALTPQQGDYRVGLSSTQLAFDLKAAPVVERVDAAVAARQDFVERWGWLSPALAARIALEAAAGSDLRRYQHFMVQVDAYQASWREYFRPMVLSLRNLRAADYDAIPRFRYAPPVSGLSIAPALLRTLAAAAAWLLAAATVAASAAAWRGRRAREVAASALGGIARQDAH